MEHQPFVFIQQMRTYRQGTHHLWLAFLLCMYAKHMQNKISEQTIETSLMILSLIMDIITKGWLVHIVTSALGMAYYIPGSMEIEACNPGDCLDTTTVADLWGPWSQCSASCGPGSRTRWRPAAQGTEEEEEEERQVCDLGICPPISRRALFRKMKTSIGM